MGKRDKALLVADSILSRAVNLKSGIHFVISDDKKFLKRNCKLKLDAGDIDTCFIIGNGPSLKKVDLSLLAPFPCFTVNMFYEGIDRFQSTYHVLFDPSFVEEDFTYLQRVYKKNSNTIIIVNSILREKLQKKGMIDHRTYFICPCFSSYGKKVLCNMEKGMTGSLNVIPIAIECAIYMGYKKIYLLGCDFNSYAIAKNEHFYDADGYEERTSRGDIVGDLLRCALVHNQHYALDEYSRSVGSRIVNLTEGSLIDAYDRELLENVL